MESRVCSKCGIDKPIIEFAFRDRKKGVRNGKCKLCANAVTRAHYYRNVSYYRNRNQLRTKYNIARIRQIKETTPCADCDRLYPFYVMDFDHIAGEKRDHVACLIKSNTWPTVQREIDNCELVCSNCHRVRTYNRGLSSIG